MFLLVGISESRKIPVGYFLERGVRGDNLAEKIKKCLGLAAEAGMQDNSNADWTCHFSNFLATIQGWDVRTWHTYFVDSDVTVDSSVASLETRHFDYVIFSILQFILHHFHAAKTTPLLSVFDGN